jgi:hypothetical protein
MYVMFGFSTGDLGSSPLAVSVVALVGLGSALAGAGAFVVPLSAAFSAPAVAANRDPAMVMARKHKFFI